MLKLFDTHCHINDERFQSDRAEVIARMREAGIRRAVVVGDGARSPSDAFALARENDFLYAAAGVHPHDASLWTDEHPRLIRE
ncbi:MAG: TatD family hydrolase, partial [Clostridia bacterium]|nr:TatD family hydrolase [Clostridia bacterium]